MMNAQQLSHLASLSHEALSLAAGQALPLGSQGGRLEVIAGRVWLTREGELDDHLVAGGQSVCVAGAAAAVIEAWGDSQAAVVAWHPRRPTQRAADAFRTAVARLRAIAPAHGVGRSFA